MEIICFTNRKGNEDARVLWESAILSLDDRARPKSTTYTDSEKFIKGFDSLTSTVTETKVR